MSDGPKLHVAHGATKSPGSAPADDPRGDREALPKTRLGAPLPMWPMCGDLYVPAWTIRPGLYRAIAPYADGMQLWLLIYSRNGDDFVPSYHTREQLGNSLGGWSRATVSRRIKLLLEGKLLFEVERWADRRTKKHKPPCRWALDPFKWELWSPKVEEHLRAVALEDGPTKRWLVNALESLNAYERWARGLAAKIADDMPVQPSKRTPKRKRAKKRGASKRKRIAGVKIEPTTQLEPQGVVFTKGGSVRVEVLNGRSPRSNRRDGSVFAPAPTVGLDPSPPESHWQLRTFGGSRLRIDPGLDVRVERLFRLGTRLRQERQG